MLAVNFTDGAVAEVLYSRPVVAECDLEVRRLHFSQLPNQIAVVFDEMPSPIKPA